MAGTHLLCRGRSNRNRSIFDTCFGKHGHSTWFGVREKAKEGIPSNLLIVRDYATNSEEAEKQKLGRIIKEGAGGNWNHLIEYNGQQLFSSLSTINQASFRLRASPQLFSRLSTINQASFRLRASPQLFSSLSTINQASFRLRASPQLFNSLSTISQAFFRLRVSPQGNRTNFHTTSLSLGRSSKIMPYLKRGDKMKLELKLNIRSHVEIYCIKPVKIKGKRVVRFYNDDFGFVRKWLPYAELLVKNQPADLRAVMDRYWLLPPFEGPSDDIMRASAMLHYGVKNKLPLFDNYWEETVRIALPFIKENGDHYLGRIVEDLNRGRIYDDNEFVKGLSQIVGKQIAIEYEDITGEIEGLLLLFDEDKKLINHPDGSTIYHPSFIF